MAWEKVQTIKSGDVIHDYKMSFKFQENSDGLQRVQLATVIADRPITPRLVAISILKVSAIQVILTINSLKLS